MTEPTTLFAALDVLDGKVNGDCYKRPASAYGWCVNVGFNSQN